MPAGETLSLSKRHSFRDMSTRDFDIRQRKVYLIKMRRLWFCLVLSGVISVLLIGGSCESPSPSAHHDEESLFDSRSFVRDCDYQECRIFDLAADTFFQPGDSVMAVLLYEMARPYAGEAAWPAYLAVDPRDTTAFPLENLSFTNTANTGVRPIDPAMYICVSDPQSNRHYIVFDSQHNSSRALGVFMHVRRADGSVCSVGDISGDTLLLKLMYHTRLIPQFETWNLMWRNCYRIPSVPWEDVQIKVFRCQAGSEGSDVCLDYQDTLGESQSYLEILGLDQYNTDNLMLPDGKFDNSLPVFVPEWELLVFPHRQPFASDTTYTDANGIRTIELAVKTPGIYDYSSPVERFLASRYYIEIAVRVGN
ncbi:MAG: hypothetical protein ABII79_04960 [bacterium]